VELWNEEADLSSSIEVDRVRKALQGRPILKDISFSVEKGDIFGFLGPNGAGKTTTIRILLGLYRADSGHASVMGCDVSSDASRESVGFVLDGDGLYEGMTAAANLAYYLKIYGKPVDDARIDRALGLVGLADRAADKAGTYSKGMRQRLALARALVHDPEVLILDEPTSGVDPTAQMEIRQIMLDIAHKEGKTVFLSSHNLDEVQRICNRIAMLDKGEIRLYGDLEELRRTMGRDTVSVEVGAPVPEEVVMRLREKAALGLQEDGAGPLLFAPLEGIEVADIVGALSAEGVDVAGVLRSEASLEDMYSTIVRTGASS
jgi:ABC-2 type transport system ATP-binding protein